ncbi:hypothetical protein MVES1_001962, partial [Malassezia vespertilionis]
VIAVYTASAFAHDNLLRRASPSNAAEFAQLRGSSKQCADYGIPALNKMVHDHEFPKVGKIASILEHDDDARALYNSIQHQIPNIGVRESKSHHTEFGDDTKQYPESDPDCWWSMSGCHKPKHDTIPADVYQCPGKGTWGLTFDDGPYCAQNKLYNFLQEQDLRATMFFIGGNVINSPFQAQRALVDGHDICGHTWSHKLMTTLSNEQVFAELYYTAKAIKKIVGVTPRCWRPPQGDVDDRVRAIATALGMHTIMWQEDTNDWQLGEGASRKKIAHNYHKIFEKANHESPIVLTHELPKTMSEFIRMYPDMKAAYKHVVPVSACVNATNPYPEQITYPTMQQFVSGQRASQGLPSGERIRVNPDAKPTFTPTNNQQNSFS